MLNQNYRFVKVGIVFDKYLKIDFIFIHTHKITLKA